MERLYQANTSKKKKKKKKKQNTWRATQIAAKRIT